MERLTYEKSRSRWNEGRCPTKYTSRHTFQEVVARLAAYEDTMPLERAQELAQAEKDGRLVVLDEPRKPLVWGDDRHDTIFCPNCNHDLMGVFPEDEYCEKDMYQCPYCGQAINSGKAMTREEAEAALEKRAEADNETD